jgi:hypothetical protein
MERLFSIRRLLMLLGEDGDRVYGDHEIVVGATAIFRCWGSAACACTAGDRSRSGANPASTSRIVERNWRAHT